MVSYCNDRNEAFPDVECLSQAWPGSSSGSSCLDVKHAAGGHNVVMEIQATIPSNPNSKKENPTLAPMMVSSHLPHSLPHNARGNQRQTPLLQPDTNSKPGQSTQPSFERRPSSPATSEMMTMPHDSLVQHAELSVHACAYAAVGHLSCAAT